jgi:hypothetical protein
MNQDVADAFVNGKFIGTDLETGSDAEQRADVQRVYQQVLDQVARKRKKSNLEQAWRDAHNSWHAATG